MNLEQFLNAVTALHAAAAPPGDDAAPRPAWADYARRLLLALDAHRGATALELLAENAELRRRLSLVETRLAEVEKGRVPTSKGARRERSDVTVVSPGCDGAGVREKAGVSLENDTDGRI